MGSGAAAAVSPWGKERTRSPRVSGQLEATTVWIAVPSESEASDDRQMRLP